VSATIAFDNGLVMDFSPLTAKVSEKQFAQLCRRNPELRIELTSEGDLIIIPPAGGKTGARNFYLTAQFGVWVQKDGSGRGSIHQPNSLYQVAPSGRPMFRGLEANDGMLFQTKSTRHSHRSAPISSSSLDQGAIDSKNCSLRWKSTWPMALNWGALLILLTRRFTFISPQAPVEVLDNPKEISGEPLLKGFVLDVQALWTAGD
jgi:hypothetical protein